MLPENQPPSAGAGHAGVGHPTTARAGLRGRSRTCRTLPHGRPADGARTAQPPDGTGSCEPRLDARRTRMCSCLRERLLEASGCIIDGVESCVQVVWPPFRSKVLAQACATGTSCSSTARVPKARARTAHGYPGCKQVLRIAFTQRAPPAYATPVDLLGPGTSAPARCNRRLRTPLAHHDCLANREGSTRPDNWLARSRGQTAWRRCSHRVLQPHQ